MNMPRFFLRRNRYTPDREEYWYEVMESFQEYPLAVRQERSLLVVHSEATGRIIVDKLNEQYKLGLIDGIKRFAWWRDGEQMVGTCGTRLKRAIKDALNEVS